LTSAVRVVVIDCTEIGYSLPTPTADMQLAVFGGAERRRRRRAYRD